MNVNNDGYTEKYLSLKKPNAHSVFTSTPTNNFLKYLTRGWLTIYDMSVCIQKTLSNQCVFTTKFSFLDRVG